jgi:DeoR/GlpR family transcriptional regulator of sugar metabolism
MIAEARQARIEAHLQRVEFASLDELSREVGASLSTVRRDLAHLEAAGAVARTHGGARLVQPRSDEFAFNARNTRETSEKDAIARACAALVAPNQTVILDAGSTVFHVAEQLAGRPLQIVTNSLPVANLFASAANTEVIVSGGVIYPRLGVLVGPQAVETFSKVHADIAILGASGITAEGIFNSHGLLVDIQRAMLQAAPRVVFCLDHTKFDRRSMFFLGDFSRVGAIVTDSGAPAALLDAIRARGVDVVVAPLPEPSLVAAG